MNKQAEGMEKQNIYFITFVRLDLQSSLNTIVQTLTLPEPVVKTRPCFFFFCGRTWRCFYYYCYFIARELKKHSHL